MLGNSCLQKYVDLTHAFEPGIPRWPGFPDETQKTILKKWEGEHGRILMGAFVAMRTDWSKRWANAAKMDLDQVPESGTIIVVTFLTPKGGSGFPARVFAILP